MNNKLNSTLVLVSDTPRLPKRAPPASTWPAWRRQTYSEEPSGENENKGVKNITLKQSQLRSSQKMLAKKKINSAVTAQQLPYI